MILLFIGMEWAIEDTRQHRICINETWTSDQSWSVSSKILHQIQNY